MDYISWFRFRGAGFMVKKVLKAVWEFCSYLFVPQWGKHPKDVGFTEIRN